MPHCWQRRRKMRASVDPRFNKVKDDERKQCNLVVAAYRSVQSTLAYVTMPITSGKRLYDVMEAHGVRTRAELKEKYPKAVTDEIIPWNNEHGFAFAAAVKTRTRLPVVLPGAFEGGISYSWREEQYMYMWLRMMEDLCAEHHLIEGWEYSDGSVEEFAKSMEMKKGYCDRSDITVLDQNGNEMTLERGEALVRAARADILRRGFSASMHSCMHEKIRGLL